MIIIPNRNEAEIEIWRAVQRLQDTFQRYRLCNVGQQRAWQCTGSICTAAPEHSCKYLCSEDAMPLVECMDPYETIDPSEKEDATSLIGGLWNKPFLPYKHQYESWKATRKGFVGTKVKSIVVTTVPALVRLSAL